MGRGPGAVTLAALPPARAWYSGDRGSAVPERGSARLPVWELQEAGVTWPRGVSRLAGSGSPLEGAQRRSQAQTCTRAAGAFRGAILSLRSALGSRHVRSLPEARAGAQGSPLTAAVGVDLGGREGGSRMCLLPLPPLLRFFSPSLNARCHLFAASHVSIVACQELWPGFGGPGLDRC